MYQKLACVFIGALLAISLSFHVNAKVRGEAVVTTIKSEVRKVFIARKVISSKFPIGVETIYKPFLKPLIIKC